jgi:hypothetical protein
LPLRSFSGKVTWYIDTADSDLMSFAILYSSAKPRLLTGSPNRSVDSLLGINSIFEQKSAYWHNQAEIVNATVMMTVIEICRGR